jgi:hypothetical protein
MPDKFHKFVFMNSKKRNYSFKENVESGERCYPFHSGEEKDLQSSIRKVICRKQRGHETLAHWRGLCARSIPL